MPINKNFNKNFLATALYEIVSMLVPVFTVFYVTRVLGADRIGAYSYSTSICSYFVMIATLGFSTYGKREVAFYQDNPVAYSKVFKEIVTLKLIITPLVLIIYFIYILTLGRDKILLFILSFNIINCLVDISWFYSGLEEFQKIANRSLLIKILYVFSIYLFIKSKSDFYLYCFIEVFQLLSISISLWIGLPKYITKTPKLDYWRHLKPAISLFIPSLAIQIYTVLDKSMIGFFSLNSYDENGYYELAQNFVKACLVLATTMGSVAFPRISYAISQNDLDSMKGYLYGSFRFAWATAIPLIVVINAIASRLVPLYYGAGYDKVVLLVHAFSPIVLAISLSNVVGIQYFIPRNFVKMYTASLLTGSIINFLLNLILIPRFFSVGATIASVIAEWSVTICQLIFVAKIGELRLGKIFIISIRYFICGVFLSVILYMLNSVVPFSLLGILIMIIVFLVSYLLLLVIMRDKFILNALQGLVKKKGHFDN